MNMCDHPKLTPFGWPAYCTQPAGHLGQHSSADFEWMESDWIARIKPLAQNHQET